MEIAFAYAFFISAFFWIAESLTTKVWWKLTFYLISFVYTGVPFFSGLYEFFTSDRSKLKRVHLQILKYYYGTRIDEVLQSMYFKRKEIYCNPFNFMSIDCGHPKVIIECEGDDEDACDFYDVKDKNCHMFTTSKDTSPEDIAYLEGLGFKRSKHISKKALMWSSSDYRKIEGILWMVESVRHWVEIKNTSFHLKFHPHEGYLKCSLRSRLSPEYEKVKVDCSWDSFNYCSFLFEYISFWGRDCCFVSKCPSKMGSVTIKVLHCMRIDEVIKSIASGKRTKYERVDSRYKCFEGQCSKKGIYFSLKFGDDFERFFSGYLNKFYPNQLEEIMDSFTKYSSSKGLRGGIKSLCNWQFKRLIVDVSYLFEKMGTASIGGCDLSINPSVKVISYFRDFGGEKVKLIPQPRNARDENFFSLNLPKNLTEMKLFSQLNSLQNNKNKKLPGIFMDIIENSKTWKDNYRIKTKFYERHVVLKTDFYSMNKPLLRRGMKFVEKITYKGVKESLGSGLEEKNKDCDLKISTFNESIDLFFSKVDKFLSQGETIPRQILKILNKKIEYLGLDGSKYKNLVEAFKKEIDENSGQKKRYNFKNHLVFERNQKAKLRKEMRIKNLRAGKKINSKIDLVKELYLELKKINILIRSSERLEHSLIKKAEKYKKFKERMALKHENSPPEKKVIRKEESEGSSGKKKDGKEEIIKEAESKKIKEAEEELIEKQKRDIEALNIKTREEEERRIEEKMKEEKMLREERIEEEILKEERKLMNKKIEEEEFLNGKIRVWNFNPETGEYFKKSMMKRRDYIKREMEWVKTVEDFKELKRTNSKEGFKEISKRMRDLKLSVKRGITDKMPDGYCSEEEEYNLCEF